MRRRYLDESPPPPDSDEMALLKAMLEAYYSLFQVVSSERGVGVTVRDLFRRDIGFMADIGLSIVHKGRCVRDPGHPTGGARFSHERRRRLAGHSPGARQDYTRGGAVVPPRDGFRPAHSRPGIRPGYRARDPRPP